MKAKKKRLLKHLTSFCAGIVALVVALPVVVMASEDAKPLGDFNGGAAGLLDTLDRGQCDGTVQWQAEEVSEEEEAEGHTSDLVMANVRNSLNVRTEPNEEAAKVGLLYADCGGTILETDGDWTKIQSGNLIGWASSEYLLFDEEAEALAEEVGRTVAHVEADALRVRKDKSEEAGVWGLVKNGDEIEVIVENSDEEWVAIEYEGEEGFISAEYVSTRFEVDQGETYDEIKERERLEREEKAKLIANLGPVAVGATDETLLGALVYCEAGNQPYEGKLAVAAVVMNRVRSGAYPNTVAGVIYASGQFGPAASGKVEERLAKGVPEACLTAARDAINGSTNIGSATHFKRYTGQDGVVIGAHVFY